MKRKILAVGLAAAMVLVPAVGCSDAGEAEDVSEYRLDAYMRPVWEGTQVVNETAMILRNADGSLPEIGLLYDIEEVVAVRNYALDKLYTAGEDYSVRDGKLIIAEDGAIAADLALDYDGYYFPVYREGDLLATGGGGLLSTEASYGLQGLGKWQISVTYTHAETDSPIGVPQTHSEKFQRTISKLESGEQTNIVCLGDSISAGWSASGYTYCNISPWCPPYFELAAAYLGEYYGNANVNAANFSVGGMTSAWGCEAAQIASIVQESPDLLILAFGMNDGVSGGLSVETYRRNMLAIVDGVREQCPDVEVVLVSPMLPNAEVANMLVNQYNYVAALKEIAAERENVAVADVGTISFRLLQCKKFRDVSANNVNHPNDFLHRIYAQTVVKTIADIL